MNKKTTKIIFSFILLIFIIGCTTQQDQTPEETIKEQQISENARIITTERTYNDEEYQRTDIRYERDNQEYQNYFEPQFQPALDWIKENTEQTTKFLNWWDYGHMIRGYTGRDTIIFSPSEDILWSLASQQWDEEASGRFSTKQEINDVATALTTEDPEITIEILKRYNADYIFTTKRDEASAFIFFKITDKEGYIEEYKPKEKALNTILFKLLNKEEIEGLELVYQDDITSIYRLK